MSYDIYGNRIRPGHCEVHPDVAQHFPCDCCYTEQHQQSQPEPCQNCYYATGHMQECDGTCERLPMTEWEYFKAHPEDLPT